MIRPDQDPIVSDAHRWSWPRLGGGPGRGRDLNLGTHGQPAATPVDGSRARTGDGRPLTSPDAAAASQPQARRDKAKGQKPASGARSPASPQKPARTGQQDGVPVAASVQASAVGGLRTLLIGAVILAIALFHAAPHLADWLGDPRQVLAERLFTLPFAEFLIRAASGWLWEPTWVWLGATALRLRALQRLARDPGGAVTLALIALIFQTGVWLFSELTIGDPGIHSVEQSALTVMLFVEGAVILCLYSLTGRRTSPAA
jgi:hypothetical protein